MKEGLYIGIDVACAKDKRLPVAAVSLEPSGRILVPLRSMAPEPPRGYGNCRIAVEPKAASIFAEDTASWLNDLEQRLSLKIKRIAIDAPQTPRSQQVEMRMCERALAKAKIKFIKTPSKTDFVQKQLDASAHLEAGKPVSSLPGANLWWMKVGFALFSVLGKLWECIETYPQAILHNLKYKGLHKAKDHAKQLAHLSTICGIQNLTQQNVAECAFGTTHDRVDAIMSAWVASLPVTQLQFYGKETGDRIAVPKILE